MGALVDVNVDIRENEILAIIGPSGADKTTTSKAISGMLRTEDAEVTDGSIEFNGKRLRQGFAAWAKIRSGSSGRL